MLLLEGSLRVILIQRVVGTESVLHRGILELRILHRDLMLSCRDYHTSRWLVKEGLGMDKVKDSV